MFTCTLTLGKEGEAQFIGRKVLLFAILIAVVLFLHKKIVNLSILMFREHPLAFSQGRLKIRRRLKGYKTQIPQFL